MKRSYPVFILLLQFLFLTPCLAEDHSLVSPDGTLELKITTGNGISWQILVDRQPVSGPNNIALLLDRGGIPGDDARNYKSELSAGRDEVVHPIPTKSALVPDVYNELALVYPGGYTIRFRLYDNGMAYRFETAFTGKIRVVNEKAPFGFLPGSRAWFPEEKSYVSHFERDYLHLGIDTLRQGRFCYLPLLLETGAIRLAITEADLYDYPGMFLAGTEGPGLEAVFPPVVLEIKPGRYPDRDMIIGSQADYIAETEGTRTFPWRVVMVARKDADLLTNQMVYLLSRPQKEGDISWIKPGMVMWDWWNALNIYGVDFRAGINTETYKYFIDAASIFGVDYIILDEGWSPTTNLLETVPQIDLPAIIEYGRERGVGIILWVLWSPLDANLDQILETYAAWGVKGIKVDFMQRTDQHMVSFYERVAARAFEMKLIIDFHGAFKPAGLSRKYPNVLNYEGVKGLEHSRWSEAITPDHDLIIPFTRMLAGPMDYTPGAMNNGTRENFRVIFNTPMSQGTRCHQAAMYVIYEAPLQMLSDNPTGYLEESDYTWFISHIPVTWDDTRILEASVGDYLVLARRKGDDWYLAGMTDWTPREFDIPLEFLGNGAFDLFFLEDGINADRQGRDYAMGEARADRYSVIHVKMAPGGGWVGVLRKAAGED